MFNNISDALSWILKQVKYKEKTDVNIVKRAIDLSDIKLENVKKIHIGGTNGKGSTTSFLTHILIEEGYKVGTFTSPFLIKFNERIRINFKLISDEKLLNIINFLYQLNKEMKLKYNEFLSFYELLTIGALKYFDNEACEYIIMEVGVGGLLDATNAINYDVSLITNVGFDHQQALGSSLKEIAFNKLGIVKENHHLITTIDKSLHSYVKNELKERGSTHLFVNQKDIKSITNNLFSYKGSTYEIPLLGEYQLKNASLAIEAAKYLIKDIDNETIKEGIRKTKWDGRLQLIGKNIYVDAAHNIDSIKALDKSVRKIFKEKKINLLVSFLKDKEIEKMLEYLSKSKYNITLTSFVDDRFESLEKYSNKRITYVEDPFEHIDEFKDDDKKDELLIITGSIHFIGYILNNIK